VPIVFDSTSVNFPEEEFIKNEWSQFAFGSVANNTFPKIEIARLSAKLVSIPTIFI